MATGVPKRKTGNGGAHAIILDYPGRRSRSEIEATAPAQLETVWKEVSDVKNKLYFGDNLPILASLAQDSSVVGKVRLVYIDPPFATQTVFHSRTLRHAYEDTIAGAEFIEFLRARLILLHKLLADDGALYLHLDDKMLFHMKLVLDEVFGVENYRNCITRKKCNPKNYTRRQYGNVADYILFYSKSDSYVWNRPVEAWTEERAKEYQYVEPETGRRFMKVPVHAPGVRNGETGKPWRGMMPPPGKHWQFTPSKLDELDARGEIFWSANGNPRRKVYLDASSGIGVQDIWTDFRDAHNQNICVTGYPTEKNPALLRRIVAASSNPGDLVLDCFSGSGTTLAVASELGRRWIGVDSSSEAIATTLKRFVHGTKPMGDFVSLRLEKGLTSKVGCIQENLPFMSEEEGCQQRSITNFSINCSQADSEAISDSLGEWIRQVGPGLVESELLATDWSKAERELAKRDKVLARVIESVGRCELRKIGTGFGSLARAIIGQQLSKNSAGSIEKKVLSLLERDEIEPELFLKLSDSSLAKAGLSARKIEAIKSLARSVTDGPINLESLHALDDEAIIKTLCTVKGIGRWTAEMYLIFSMLRPDVLPLDDAALRRAISMVYGVQENQFERRIHEIADAWRPHRTVACWYLYAYLDRHLEPKGRSAGELNTDQPIAAVG